MATMYTKKSRMQLSGNSCLVERPGTVTIPASSGSGAIIDGIAFESGPRGSSSFVSTGSRGLR